MRTKNLFGLKHATFDPGMYVCFYRNGELMKEGEGLSFYYLPSVTSIVAVPTTSEEVPFILQESTRDYQNVTVQGQVSFRVEDPKQVAGLFNFSLDPLTMAYISEDPSNLSQRVINTVQVLIKKELEQLTLKEAIRSTDLLAQEVTEGIRKGGVLGEMGLSIVGFSILAVKPSKEMARALEAETREIILKEADDALYARRNASVEQERKIKENELGTQLAIELKEREIKESEQNTALAMERKEREIQEVKQEAELEVQRQQHLLREEEASFTIAREREQQKQQHLLKEQETDFKLIQERETQRSRLETRQEQQEKLQKLKALDMKFNVIQEKENCELVKLKAANTREETEARILGMTAVMKNLETLDPATIQALAMGSLEPQKILALAMKALGENAARIGNLSITPDILGDLLKVAEAK